MPDASFYIGSNIILFGYHIHHFYFGVLLMGVAGWLSLTASRRFSVKQLAVIYGAGLGLFFDEIGLLLTWGDYYSSLSYLLSLLLAGIFLNIIFFSGFWESVKENLSSSRPRTIVSNMLVKHTTFIKFADFISEKTGKTEKTSLIFTGLLYLVIAAIIVAVPQTLRYWVSLIFIIQGIDYFIKFF